MSDDPCEILDVAAEQARQRGYACDGWTLQLGEDGYAAWLYHEDDHEQHCLFECVEVQSSAREAALWCLGGACGLLPQVPEAEG